MSVRDRDSPADPLLKAIGDRVRARRDILKLTRRDLAQRTGLSERFLAQVESGRGNIAVTRLATLAQAIGSSVSELTQAPPRSGHRQPVLALLGVRGAGKSSLGTEVGQRLGIGFQELDRLVEEAAGISIAEVFTLHGEAYYRRLSGQVLDQLLAATTEPLILASGGGVIQEAEAFDLLLRRTHTVWLKATATDHWDRVLAQGDTRPMGSRRHARAELDLLLEKREPLYAQAEHVIDTSALGWESALATLQSLGEKLLEDPQS